MPGSGADESHPRGSVQLRILDLCKMNTRKNSAISSWHDASKGINPPTLSSLGGLGEHEMGFFFWLVFSGFDDFHIVFGLDAYWCSLMACFFFSWYKAVLGLEMDWFLPSVKG